jgi:hypothetical protein
LVSYSSQSYAKSDWEYFVSSKKLVYIPHKMQ